MWILERNMPLSIILSSIAGMITVFAYGVLMAPHLAYRRFMLLAEEGIRREFSGAYEESGGESFRDGVRFSAMYFQTGDGGEPRLCYYDASLPEPRLIPGRLYKITQNTNLILDIEPITPGGGDFEQS